MDNAAKDKMCRLKKPFPTFDAALKGTLESSKKFGPMGLPYHCPICGKYHITSRTR